MTSYDFSLQKLRKNEFPQDDGLTGTVIFASCLTT